MIHLFSPMFQVSTNREIDRDESRKRKQQQQVTPAFVLTRPDGRRAILLALFTSTHVHVYVPARKEITKIHKLYAERHVYIRRRAGR